MSRDIVWTTKFKKDYKKHGAVALLFVRQPHKGNSVQKGIPQNVLQTRLSTFGRTFAGCS